MIFFFSLAMTEQCKTLSTSWCQDFKRVSVIVMPHAWNPANTCRTLLIVNWCQVKLSVYVLTYQDLKGYSSLTHNHKPLDFKWRVKEVTLRKKNAARLLFFVFFFPSDVAEIKKQREFYQKLGMEVPGDIKGELCNMKTHLDQRNGTLHPNTFPLVHPENQIILIVWLKRKPLISSILPSLSFSLEWYPVWHANCVSESNLSVSPITAPGGLFQVLSFIISS